MDDCPTCPTYQAQISRLQGGIAGPLALIAAEREKQTMSRSELVHAIEERLFDALHSGT